MSTFYGLDKYSEESLFNFQRDIDEKNMSLIPLLQSNSYQVNQGTQPKLIEIMVLQKRCEAFKLISSHTKNILSKQDDVASLPTKVPNLFETILWLLWKTDLTFMFQQVRGTLESIYGKNTLVYFEQFPNTNVKQLEELFRFDFREEQLKDYVSTIKRTYGLDQVIQSQGFNNFQYNENPPQFNEVIHDVSRKPLEEIYAPKFPSNVMPSSNNLRGVFNLDKNSSQEKEEEKVNNVQSHQLNFSKDENGTQISVFKGVKTVNIEFYDQIQPALKASGELFVDETFPPTPSSIAKDVVKHPIATQVVWKRIPEVYNKKCISICSEEMGPNDIHQGRIGNCFFLSALSTLAEQRHYIQRLFHSKGVSSTGCYSIWLCDSGEWRNILIDDFVPCTVVKGETIPRFSRSKGNDMWVLLLEKAYAKLYGSYFGTQSGYQGEALSALTGAPIEYLKLKKKTGLSNIDQIWLFFTGNLQNKFVCTSSSRKESETVNNKEMGLVSVHSYAVLDAQEVVLPTGERERIIKMRNPWGNREWTGEWGDDSVFWTPELKKRLNYQPQLRDGVFWISLEDFHKHFFGPCVCKVHPNFNYSFVRLGENRKQNVFIAKMLVKNSGFSYVTVQQKRRKHFRGVPEYGYSFVRVFIARLDETGRIVSVIHSKYKNDQSIVLGRHLESGNYLVFVDVDWAQNLFNELVLSSYSAIPVEFQEESLVKYNIAHLYENIMRAYIDGNPNHAKLKTTQMVMLGNKKEAWKYTLAKEFGMTTYMFRNYEKECELHFKMNITGLDNMTVAAPHTNDLSTLNIIVPPGEERVVIFKAVLPFLSKKAYSFSTKDCFAFPHAHKKDELRQLCLEKGKKLSNFKNGKIKVLSFSHKVGTAFLYINHSQNAMLRDEIKFEPSVFVNGEEKNRVEIILEAGMEYLLDTRTKNIFGKEKTSHVSNPTIFE